MFKSKKRMSLILALVLIIGSFYISGSYANAASGRWIQTNGRWWYQYGDGGYAQSEYIDGYWLDGAGWYDSSWNGHWASNNTGWWFESGSWYPTNQWLKIDTKWYHFNSSGYMDANKWIGNYYVQSDGSMATNKWIGDYYVGSDGAWIPNKTKDGSSGGNNNNTNDNDDKNPGGGDGANCVAHLMPSTINRENVYKLSTKKYFYIKFIRVDNSAELIPVYSGDYVSSIKDGDGKVYSVNTMSKGTIYKAYKNSTDYKNGKLTSVQTLSQTWYPADYISLGWTDDGYEIIALLKGDYVYQAKCTKCGEYSPYMMPKSSFSNADEIITWAKNNNYNWKNGTSSSINSITNTSKDPHASDNLKWGD